MNARVNKAMKVLVGGGKFVYRLETDPYTGFNKFKHRLLNKDGQLVRGIGHATFYELQHMLELAKGGTSVSTYYMLKDREK